jgi:hypothetical protein
MAMLWEFPMSEREWASCSEAASAYGYSQNSEAVMATWLEAEMASSTEPAC